MVELNIFPVKRIKSLVLLLHIPAILLLPLASKSQDCPPVKIADFPKNDLPSTSDLAHIKQEKSYKYYYGVGVPVDYIKARKLAFLEMEKEGNKDGDFEGSSILMMLYANGLGVKRNLDICIRLACANVGGADAEIEQRVQHLKDIRAGTSKERFDLCDDITSGYMEGMCQSVQSEIAAIKRKAALNAVIKNWPKQDLLAYEKLRKAVSAFFDERLLSEVDISGTARAAIELEESDALEDGFLETIQDADKCTSTTYSPEDFIKSDKELNLLYSKIMADKSFQWGTVTKEGIKAAQRKWIEYRDAWVAFGAVRCPAITQASWKTLITEERITQLKEFVDE